MSGKLFAKCVNAFVHIQSAYNSRTVCSCADSLVTQTSHDNNGALNVRLQIKKIAAENEMSNDQTKKKDEAKKKLYDNLVAANNLCDNKLTHGKSDHQLDIIKENSIKDYQNQKFETDEQRNSTNEGCLDRLEYRSDTKYMHIRGADILQSSPHSNDPFYMCGNDYRKFNCNYYQEDSPSQERYNRDFNESRDVDRYDYENQNNSKNTRKWWSEVRAFKDDKMIIRKPVVTSENLLANGVAKKDSEVSSNETTQEDLAKLYAQSRIVAERQLKIMKLKIAVEHKNRLKYASMTGRDWIRYWTRRRDRAYLKFSNPCNLEKYHEYQDKHSEKLESDEIESLEESQRKQTETDLGNIVVPPIEKSDILQGLNLEVTDSSTNQYSQIELKRDTNSPCKNAMRYNRHMLGSDITSDESGASYINLDKNDDINNKNMALKGKIYSGEQLKSRLKHSTIIPNSVTCALNKTNSFLDLIGSKAMFSSQKRQLPKGCPRKCPKPKPKKKEVCIPRCERKPCVIKQTIARHLDHSDICKDEEQQLEKWVEEEYGQCGPDCPSSRKK